MTYNLFGGTLNLAQFNSVQWVSLAACGILILVLYNNRHSEMHRF